MSNNETRKNVAGWILLVVGSVLFAGASSAGQLAGGFADSVVPLLGVAVLVVGTVALVLWRA